MTAMKHRINILVLGSVLVMGFFCSGCEDQDSSKLIAACQEIYWSQAEIEEMIEGGADVNARDERGNTPLLYAANSRSSAIVTLLIDAGADVHAKSHLGGVCVISLATMNSDPEVIEVLLRAGADVNARSALGGTPLMMASASCKKPGTVSQLIAAGADVNAVDDNGLSALIYAGIGSSHQSGTILVLLEAGADPSIKAEGRTALDLARNNPALKGTDSLKALRAATWN